MSWKTKLYHIIFDTDTKLGRAFDILLLWSIILSVFIVMLESVESINEYAPKAFLTIEWFFTVIFTIEYVLRILSHPKPSKYVFSFWGIVDLLAFLPTYIGLLLGGTHYLLTIRTIRLLRVFRILKLGKYLEEAQVLIRALRTSSYKIIVFFGAVLSIVIVMGTLMYLVEGPESGFDSIPHGIYWAIVTLTTVGFGDIVPTTVLGKIISSLMMITGYAIIAVPTGIITVEIGKQRPGKLPRTCSQCNSVDHDPDADFCKKCGNKLQAD
jgi:voltage-gated potassium channel